MSNQEQQQDYDVGAVPDPVMPRKRRSVFSRVFSSLFLLGIAAIVVGAIAAFIGYQEFTAPGPLAEKKVYEIDRGLDTRGIAQKLQEEGIISDARVFAAAAYLGNVLGGKLKAGEYEFPAAASMDEVLGIVASGRAITYKVTIPEGWTSEMTVARLRENEVLAGEIVSVPPEGVIRPDTYVFKRGMTRQKLLEDMQLAQRQLIEELWKNRVPNDLIKTKEDAVVLASIVEKETGRAEERAEVAAVFLNRMRQGIRLQSDPTIIYGIVGGKGKLDRPLSKADIATPTPYNTYTIGGLPPGPIGNPGAASLEAVLNPATSKNLYFVADGTGGHAFAETLEQHNANVAKWRAMEPGTAADPAQTPSEPVVAATDTPTANLDGVVDDEAPAPPADAAAVADPDAQPQPIPAPDASGEQTATAEQIAEPPAVPAETPPAGEQPADTLKPEDKEQAQQPKPADPAAPATAAEEEVLTAKPGTIMKVAGRQVPIPKQKPKRKK